jgi:RNA polymerase sigma factor (TIGR02999 family)
MSQITRVLAAVASGEPRAASQLLPLLYKELRSLAASKLAREPPGHTLSATALVHEAYLRVVSGDPEKCWEGRRHFFAAAAQAMRRILVEHARHKSRDKRGGRGQRIEFDGAIAVVEGLNVDILAVHEALDRLSQIHPEKAELVNLRYFAGLTVPEAAAILDISTPTAERHWRYARAWLARELRQNGDRPDS